MRKALSHANTIIIVLAWFITNIGGRHMRKENKIIIILSSIIVTLIIALIATYVNYKNTIETYDIENIVESISDDIQVEIKEHSDSVDPYTVLEEYKGALVYRMKNSEKVFPEYLQPDKIIVDNFDNIILCYVDEEQFENEFVKLQGDSATYFVEELLLDDIELSDYSVGFVENAANGEALSYAAGLMNTREKVKRLMDSGVNGKITIGVADTGLYSKNSKIAKYVDERKSFDYVNGDNNVYDMRDTHATMVMSTMYDLLGEEFIEEHITFVSAKCLQDGRGSTYTLYNAICALSEQVDIINMSLGSRGENELVKFAVDYATEKGVILVAASGNDSSSSASFPAKYEECISVSAMGERKKLSWFSNYGKVDITAFGENIIVDSIEYSQALVDGTSFSCPMISAVVAVAKLENSEIDTKAEAMNYMKMIAEDIGNDGNDKYYGWGLPVFKLVDEEPTEETTTVKMPETEEPTEETTSAKETEESTTRKPEESTTREPEEQTTTRPPQTEKPTEETTTKEPVTKEPETTEPPTREPETTEPPTKEPETEKPVLDKVTNIDYYGYGSSLIDGHLYFAVLSNQYSFDRVEGADHYEVWYADYDGKSDVNKLDWKLRGTTFYHGFVDHNLAYGMDILIKIRAVDKAGNCGPFSEIYEIKLLDYEEFRETRKFVSDTGTFSWTEDYYDFDYYRMVLFGINVSAAPWEVAEDIIIKNETTASFTKVGTYMSHRAQLLCYTEVIINGEKVMLSIGDNYSNVWRVWY